MGIPVIARLLVVASILLLPVHAPAAALQVQTFLLPNQGKLHLPVPASWRSKLEQPPGNLPPTIALTPGAGSGFKVLVTTVWPVARGAMPPVREQVRKTVEQAAEEARQQSVEQQITLKDLKGPSAAGFYFSTTDRAPKPDEYKHLTQGAFVVGDLLVMFTALAKDGSQGALSDAVSAMAGATYDAPESTAGREAGSERGEPVKVTERKSDYLVTQPGSALGLHIPKGRLRLQAAGGEGADWNPRYFAFKEADGDLMFSGWFSPERQYPGLVKKWLEETRSWPALGLPDPRELSFGWLSGWEAVFYDIAVPGGISSHVRAHWVQAGTWIDLHLSITAGESSSALRSRLKTLLESMEVEMKR